MRTRARDILAALLIVGIPLGLFLTWTEASLRPDLERQSARQLGRLAHSLSREAGGQTPSDSLADRLGAGAGVRVTFVGGGGAVLGDSDVPSARLSRLDDHGNRPEIRQAREEGLGYSSRGSRSVALPLYYVAIPYGSGFLRLAAPRSEITTTLDRVRGAAVLLAGLSLVLLLFGSRRSSAPQTASRTAARELAAVRERAHADVVEVEQMLDAIDDGVAVFGADGRVVRGNLAFERWTGVSTLAGRSIGTLFRHPGPRRAVDGALAGRPTVLEAELGVRTVEIRTAPFRDGALLRIHDLTRTRRLEGMRRDFVANVSHELKTPLTSIRGFAEPLLEGGIEGPQAEEFLRRILANTDRMQHLVDDLLDLTRIESGGWSPAPENLDVGSTAARVWRRMESVASVRSITLRISNAGPPGEEAAAVLVRADAEAVEHILANLFDNAIRYSPVGGTVTVRYARRADEDDVRVEIADDGPGIAAEHAGRVFERFYRADAGRSRDRGGTGLGLAIVKHLVVAHGGRVGIDTELGRGATVWFELPAVTAAAADGGGG
ncbi:MAG: ATP-binding protein [Gemmatimonadota bacterium]